MLRGFEMPPEPLVPYRPPLQPPLDARVVEKMSQMTSLGLGSAQSIQEKLSTIIESPEYIKAALAMDLWVASQQASITRPQTQNKLSVFNFYRRRPTVEGLNTAPEPTAEDWYPARTPPLIMIYYLTREKIERETDAGLAEHSFNETQSSLSF
jgi:hypothetical protein